MVIKQWYSSIGQSTSLIPKRFQVRFLISLQKLVVKVVRIRQPVCKIGLKREWFESTTANVKKRCWFESNLILGNWVGIITDIILLWTFGIAGAYASLKNQRTRFDSLRVHWKCPQSMVTTGFFNQLCMERFRRKAENHEELNRICL